ncbi:MAG: putative baseplate assembly protein, partial [Leptospirales bacterium]
AVEPIPRIDVVAGDRLDLDRIVIGLDTGRPLILTGLRSRLQVRDDVEALTGGFPRIISTDGARTAHLAPGDILTVLKSFEETAGGDQVWSLESETGFTGTVTVLAANIAATFETIGADLASTPVSEVAFLKNTLQSQKYSTLQFEAPLRFSYDRTTISVQANVVPATHGEIVEEILGSGDGSAVFQNFALKNPPLTYVSAPTETGIETTLEVRVNDVLWEESSTLFGLGARDRKYAVRHEDDGSVRVVFGDGKSGERLPTGPENVKAVYRKGIGPDGEIGANKLRIVQNAPVGVSEVDNPLPAAGASAPEPASEARVRAPFSVLTLGRIVSLKDFQDFARGFGGIGKARATSLWQEEVQLVYITIAGAGGAPVLTNSELYLNLGRALDRVRDPFQPVRIASFEPLFFNVAAKLLIDPTFIPARVFAAAGAAIRGTFAFERREFGQEVTVAELIQILEAVEGVEAVDFDQLSLTADALFNMSIAEYQSDLENTSTIREAFRVEFNNQLAIEDPTRAALSTDALVFEEKKGLRWVLREPGAEDGYAIIKEAGSLNVYDYPALVTPFLGAAFARRDESGVFLPAQMLLLNSDAAGVILMEFTN